MGMTEFREKLTVDQKIRDAVAMATGPALIQMIESGQPLNNPTGFRYRSQNDDEVHHLVGIICDYMHLCPEGSPDRRRAEKAMACGHGSFLMDSCALCEAEFDDTPGQDPRIALVGPRGLFSSTPLASVKQA